MADFRALTRRSLISILGAVVAGLNATTAAQAKSSKAAANYRGAPNGGQSCANCSYFNPPSGCGVVSGPVSARGWCNLWG
jgi:hypothetical protein